MREPSKPDRFALWAVIMALVAMGAVAASAQAGSGGSAFNGGAATTGSGCSPAELGSRALKRGDCGNDVRTLNWILRSKEYARVTKQSTGGVSLGEEFDRATHDAVRTFERSAGIAVDGVVEDETHTELVATMPAQLATWYGPGFFGQETACGQTLRRTTVGVAHKRLPCGSKVVVRYRGRYLRTKVIDRGPFANGAKWDLTQSAARALRFKATDEIRVATLAKR